SLDGAGESVNVGVAFIDTSIGAFNLGQFQDDCYRSRLRTLVAHYNVVQVLYEKQNLSKSTHHMLSTTLGGNALEALTPNKEFWDAEKTLKFLAEGDYFCDKPGEVGKTNWPEGLIPFLDEGSTLGLNPKADKALAVKSLGGIAWYLMACKLDQELFSMKKFMEYTPVDEYTPDKKKDAFGRFMVLDAITMKNLDVLENNALDNYGIYQWFIPCKYSCFIGGTEGTLSERLDHCTTHFGKRLFQQWLCNPLCSVSAIIDRQKAIEDLLKFQGILSDVRKLMKTLPDFERLVSKIHTQGHLGKSLNHPDSRAIFFEEAIYSKKKISALMSAINGFKSSLEILDLFKGTVLNEDFAWGATEEEGTYVLRFFAGTVLNEDFAWGATEEEEHIRVREDMTSKVLKNVLTETEEGGQFPVFAQTLKELSEAFDQIKAKSEGKIVPRKGADAEYDEAVEGISEIQLRLDQYLKEQQKVFGCKRYLFQKQDDDSVLHIIFLQSV
ncbi:hypothetical protein QYM36_014126, partial [Artemia franciscana]